MILFRSCRMFSRMATVNYCRQFCLCGAYTSNRVFAMCAYMIVCNVYNHLYISAWFWWSVSFPYACIMLLLLLLLPLLLPCMLLLLFQSSCSSFSLFVLHSTHNSKFQLFITTASTTFSVDATLCIFLSFHSIGCACV